MRKYKETEKSSVVFPLGKGEIYPLKMIYSHFGDFVKLVGLFALINTIAVMVLGRSYICGLGIYGKGVYCLNQSFAVIGSLLVTLFVISCFINRWFLLIEEGKSFDEVVKIKPNYKDFKTMCFVVLYFGLFAVVIGGAYILNKRAVTPSFGFELMLFIALSLVMIFVIILLLNGVVFIRFLRGKKWLVLGHTFVPIFDNIYKIIFWFVSYLFFFVYLLQLVVRYGVIRSDSAFFFANVVCYEFLLQVIMLLIASCFVSSLTFQEKYLFNDN